MYTNYCKLLDSTGTVAYSRYKTTTHQGAKTMGWTNDRDERLFQIFFYNPNNGNGSETKNGYIIAANVDEAKKLFYRLNPDCLITWIKC